jgi:carbonic anhydrase
MFNAYQFHFHSGSEHTIDGKRFDFEMHLVHTPTEIKNDFNYGSIAILFSVSDYTAKLTSSEQAIIDSFFDSLDLSNLTDPVVSFIPL